MNEIATSLDRVFWGLILVIVHIELNHFDILPDFIGYILVANGLGGLTGLSAHFATARTYAWVLVPVSLLEYVPLGAVGLVVGLVPLGLHCAMIWFLLGGIMDYAAAQDRPDLVELASSRRLAYIALLCATVFLTFLARGIGALAAVPAVATAVSTVVLLVMIVHLVHRVKTEIAT